MGPEEKREVGQGVVQVGLIPSLRHSQDTVHKQETEGAFSDCLILFCVHCGYSVSLYSCRF